MLGHFEKLEQRVVFAVASPFSPGPLDLGPAQVQPETVLVQSSHGNPRETTNFDVQDSLSLTDLEHQDKMTNFEVQDLMSRVVQRSQDKMTNFEIQDLMSRVVQRSQDEMTNFEVQDTVSRDQVSQLQDFWEEGWEDKQHGA